MAEFLERAQEARSIDEATELLREEILFTPTINRALDLAIASHADQKRKSGDPYVVHPIVVAAITASLSQDETMVVSALLHDVVEDTDYTIEDITRLFGEDVQHIVEGLTKIVEMRDESLAPSYVTTPLTSSALSFRKMLIASIDDVRVLIIKLCDRLHNMLTLDALSPEKQQRISEETLVVYAPIAHRLGIAKIKNLLEDLSFRYIYPNDYKKIDDFFKNNDQTLHFKLNAFIEKVKNTLHKVGYHWEEFEVIGRVKHYYSIYLKMHRKGVSIEEVLDLLAIRIILKDPLECYEALGALHLEFTPLISRFKDYIALPKENGYRTIHTTLFDEEAIVEAQIRTRDMHQMAEYGVAAHWMYKGGIEHVNLEWLKGLSYQSESVEEFYELAKSDLFSEEITIFSPRGDYFTLPKDSVALDFAYSVHSEIGHAATGALVNKEKASLLTILKNGDIVKIITDGTPRMHCSWEDTVKTSKAKAGIRSKCKKRLQETDELTGYSILATIFDKTPEAMRTIIDDGKMISAIYRIPNRLDYLKEKIRTVAKATDIKEVRFWEVLKRGYKKPVRSEVDHFVFYGNKPVDAVEFDYCCHPKVGDSIVAFCKDNKAIIHHKLCSKAYSKIIDGDPMLYVDWLNRKQTRYQLIISLQNRKGALAKLTTKLMQMNLNVSSIELGIKSSDSAEYCKLEVESEFATKEDIVQELSKKFKVVDVVALNDAYSQ